MNKAIYDLIKKKLVFKGLGPGLVIDNHFIIDGNLRGFIQDRVYNLFLYEFFVGLNSAVKLNFIFHVPVSDGHSSCVYVEQYALFAFFIQVS